MEVKDNRSIRIRKEHKSLQEYFEFLESEDKYYPHEEIHKFDDIFMSFLEETNYEASLKALNLLFKKIEFYSLELANCKIAFNIAKLFDNFLHKFKKGDIDEDVQKLLSSLKNHEKILGSLSDPTKLQELKDTEYAIGIVYLKHYEPMSVKKVSTEIAERLNNKEGTDDCVQNLIEEHYNYNNVELNKLIYFQLRSFILIKNTMILPEDFIQKSTEYLQSDSYEEDWIKIFANKIIANLIVPLISYKQINDNTIELDDTDALEWLLEFSEKGLGQRVGLNKWESINEDDFVNTWKFVKEKKTSNKQLGLFYAYLTNNGFEFHLGDSISKECYENFAKK